MLAYTSPTLLLLPFLLSLLSSTAAAASFHLPTLSRRADTDNANPPAAKDYTSDALFRATVLNVTNTYRKQHNATSLAWNDTLADGARKWSERCKFEHSVWLNRFPLLFASSSVVSFGDWTDCFEVPSRERGREGRERGSWRKEGGKEREGRERKTVLTFDHAGRARRREPLLRVPECVGEYRRVGAREGRLRLQEGRVRVRRGFLVPLLHPPSPHDPLPTNPLTLPRTSHNTGHFTQLVWKSTTSVGCGRTECNGKGEGEAPGWYVLLSPLIFPTLPCSPPMLLLITLTRPSPRFVVCNYHPPGNVLGAFTQNVQPELPADEQPADVPSDPAVPTSDAKPCPQGGVCSAGARLTLPLTSNLAAMVLGVLCMALVWG